MRLNEGTYLSKQTANSRSGGRVDQTQKIRISLTIALNVVQTSNRKSLLGLSVSKRLTTLAESVLGLGDSLKIRLLGTFGLGLGVRKISLRFDSAFIGISHILRNKTIGISLRSLGGFFGGTLIEFLNAGSLLVNIRDGINLGILGSNLIHGSAEATRKKFVIFNTLNNIENFVRLVDTDSLGLNFQAVSVR